MRHRDGFTLIEILVALMIGGLALVSAHQILTALSASAGVTERDTVAADRRANGEDLLYRLTGMLDVGSAGATPFFGADRVAEFSSWCEDPHGWLETCTIVLAVDTAGGQPAIVARLDDSTRVVLLRGFSRGAFRYLESADNSGTWQRLWGRGRGAPLAIGVIMDRDTLVVPVGPRG